MITKTRSDIRKQLDYIYSKYVRLLYADEYGMVKCSCGCGVRRRWEEVQVSHYVVRGNDSVRWEITNTVPAIQECNYYDEKHKEKIGLFINQKFGAGTTDELNQLGRLTVKFFRHEIEEKVKEYKEKFNELKRFRKL